MKELEQIRSTEPNLLISPDSEFVLSAQPIQSSTPVLRSEVVVNALKKLWRDLEIDGEPFIFFSPAYGLMHLEYHPALLDQLIAAGKRRKQPPFGQLASWEQIDAPEEACGIAPTGASISLLKANMLDDARPGDRSTVSSI